MAGAGAPGKLEDILIEMLEEVDKKERKAKADDANKKHYSGINNSVYYLAD